MAQKLVFKKPDTFWDSFISPEIIKVPITVPVADMVMFINL